MPPRLCLPPAERAARSRLVKLLASAQPLARASLVTMRRACGKAGCHCERGAKHVSLYLAARLGKKRQMIYIPQELEDQARALVETGRRVEELLEQISQRSLERLVAGKAQRRRVARQTRP
jgi:Family of unknown function (DUF6788)